MSHLPGHPPNDDSYFASEPLFKMLGPIILDKSDGFEILFLNNYGLQINKKPGTPSGTPTIGFHLLLIPIHKDAAAKKSFCGLAIDLVNYQHHKTAETNALGKLGLKGNETLEELQVSKVEQAETLVDTAEDRKILHQTSQYMKTESFRMIYYNTRNKVRPESERIEWIKENVLTAKELKQFILGSGNPSGSAYAPFAPVLEYINKNGLFKP